MQLRLERDLGAFEVYNDSVMARKSKKSELTLYEQCRILHGHGAWKIEGIERLNIPTFEMHDGPLGLRYVNDDGPLDQEQNFASICYPAPCLTACSFDVGLLSRIGASIADEALAHHTNMILAPGVNIKRNPLCGRNFEYLSEDPYLAGKLGAAYISGMQSHHVGACLKHFACNSQEAYRLLNDSIVDERALHEIYLKPFEIAIKESNPWAVMSAYNKLNGVYCSENDYLLKAVLRDQWDYQGVVMSDWGATDDYIDAHNHGLDLEMPCAYDKRTVELVQAYRFRELSTDTIDTCSQHVLDMMRKAALAPQHPKPFDYEAGHKVAVEAAEKSMVLLKNDGVLPLKSLNNVCVIGDLARVIRYQGAGSSQVKPYKLPSFLDVINENSKKSIPFAHGYLLGNNDDGDRERAVMDAVDLASKSQTVIAFVGLPEDIEAEGVDRENMLLPEDQLRMLDAIHSVNENIVVVLCVGSPTELPFIDKCKALLLAYLGGEGTAEAVLHLLRGEVSPSGKLAETWPIHLTHVPSFGFYPGYRDFSLYKESIYVGYRYYLSCEQPVRFPFGYGLSYASFKEKMTLNKNKLEKGKTITVDVDVTNLSSKPAERVAQIYVESMGGNVFKPVRTLVGFAKVALKGKEHKVVAFVLNEEAFAHYDVDSHSFKVEGGSYLLELCEDAEHVIASSKIEVEGEVFQSKQAQLPVYYNIRKSGFLFSDDYFEILLGRSFPMQKDHRSRPFTMNSTFGDISDTYIGKKIHNSFMKLTGINPDDASGKIVYASFLSMPIRNLHMGDKKFAKPKYAVALLEAANGHYFKALLRLVFGVPPRKAKGK